MNNFNTVSKGENHYLHTYFMKHSVLRHIGKSVKRQNICSLKEILSFCGFLNLTAVRHGVGPFILWFSISEYDLSAEEIGGRLWQLWAAVAGTLHNKPPDCCTFKAIWHLMWADNSQGVFQQHYLWLFQVGSKAANHFKAVSLKWANPSWCGLLLPHKYAFKIFSFLAPLSQRLIGELIGWQCWWCLLSVCCLSSTFSNVFETAGPIEVKFHMEPPWDGGTKFVRGVTSRSHD